MLRRFLFRFKIASDLFSKLMCLVEFRLDIDNPNRKVLIDSVLTHPLHNGLMRAGLAPGLVGKRVGRDP